MPIQGVLAKAEALHSAGANAAWWTVISGSNCCNPSHFVVQATKDVLAMASLEVDLSKIELGNTITVKWRGKPVFVRRRTEAEIAKANETPMSELRDPETDDQRAQKPEVGPTRCLLGAHIVYSIATGGAAWERKRGTLQQADACFERH